MCSKKIFGIALVVNGVILVALGVILGLLLQNMMLKTIEDSVCVNSKDSSGYKLWVSSILHSIAIASLSLDFKKDDS